MDEGKQQQGGHAAAADYADSLAPGYRFCPTDLELIIYYLKPKIEKQIHPSKCRFYDVNIYDYHPKQLAGTYLGISAPMMPALPNVNQQYIHHNIDTTSASHRPFAATGDQSGFDELYAILYEDDVLGCTSTPEFVWDCTKNITE